MGIDITGIGYLKHGFGIFDTPQKGFLGFFSLGQFLLLGKKLIILNC
ncbi:MAG: hypothetical protein JXK94_08225 [Deltaproteobacteria bacterium]|nr:hypothetical protein [Deltaproteobacteria bacterium]